VSAVAMHRSICRTGHFGSTCVRMVEYSPGYRSDSWSSEGHILLCVAGVLRMELAVGRMVVLGPGTSYQLSDEEQPYRFQTETGATVFIVE